MIAMGGMIIVIELIFFKTTCGWCLINVRKCPGPVRRPSALVTDVSHRSGTQALRTLHTSYVPEGLALVVFCASRN